MWTMPARPIWGSLTLVVSGPAGQPRHSPRTIHPTNPRVECNVSAGPAEYVIIGFPGCEFNGPIGPELGLLVDAGLIASSTRSSSVSLS